MEHSVLVEVVATCAVCGLAVEVALSGSASLPVGTWLRAHEAVVQGFTKHACARGTGKPQRWRLRLGPDRLDLAR